MFPITRRQRKVE